MENEINLKALNLFFDLGINHLANELAQNFRTKGRSEIGDALMVHCLKTRLFNRKINVRHT